MQEQSDSLDGGDHHNGPSLMAQVPTLSVLTPPQVDAGPSLSVVAPALTIESPSLSIAAPKTVYTDTESDIYSRLSPAHTQCKAASFMEVMSGTTGDNRSPATLQMTSELPHIMDKSKKITCIPRNMTGNETGPVTVQIVNSTGLLQHLGAKNESDGRCAVVLFYAPWCMFCAKVAPHYNALARAFPQLDILAIDAIHFSK